MKLLLHISSVGTVHIILIGSCGVERGRGVVEGLGGLVKYLFYRAYFVNGAAFSMQFDIFN